MDVDNQMAFDADEQRLCWLPRFSEWMPLTVIRCAALLDRLPPNTGRPSRTIQESRIGAHPHVTSMRVTSLKDSIRAIQISIYANPVLFAGSRNTLNNAVTRLPDGA